MTTGYSAAKPTTGIHDPLSARVLILKSNNTSVALVTWDLCIVNSPWLFEQVKPLGIDHLVLMNTHTHAGPKLAQEDFPSADKPWRETVERLLVRWTSTSVEARRTDRAVLGSMDGHGCPSYHHRRAVRESPSPLAA